ncbi:MAG: very short patch repair endonuclease [Anaerolineales bacterium]|nr:very short patch repair endonuclease [Anaerolineales bacterium]
MDTVSRKLRSVIMRKVRSTDNRSTERRLRGLLVRSRLQGWGVRPANVYGKPDFVFHKKRIAIFVDGCFWHGCRTCFRQPSDNKVYWKAKVQGNRKRESKNRRHLSRAGWRVMRVWEHELTNTAARIAALLKIRKVITNGR